MTLNCSIGGKTNVEADALSRIPWNAEIDNDSVKTIILAKSSQWSPLHETWSSQNSLNEGKDVFTVKQAHLVPHSQKTKEIPVKMTNEQWQTIQSADPDLSVIISLLKKRTLSKRKGNAKDSDDLRTMLRHRNQYVLRNKLLYKKIKSSQEDVITMQFVLPKAYRLKALKACHDDCGHLGREKCDSLLRERFYWPNMTRDMAEHIRKCERCLRFKAKEQREELKPLLATHPMELVHMDYLTIEGKDKEVNILVVTDHFTRFAQAFVTPNQTAAVTAKTLWEHYFVYYGIPEKILSDQGRNFESDLIRELCHITGVKKLRTTPYRPQTNGQCEKFNSTLINMIGTLPIVAKQHWQGFVSTLVHAYNCTKSVATGFSPHFLLFGRHPQLPIDIEFGVRTPDLVAVSTENYVQKLQKRLKWAFNKAQEVIEKQKAKYKSHYDKKVRCTKLESGDLVLVRQKAFLGKHKIQDRWENEPYIVLEQVRPDAPVFKVAREGETKSRTLHRNMLFPLAQGVQSDELAEDQSGNVPPPAPEETSQESLVAEDTDPLSMGPVTRGKAKKLGLVLAKANQLMYQLFDTM